MTPGEPHGNRKIYLPLAKLSKCAKCGAPDKADQKLRLCTACGEVAYCSTECQKDHWANHKEHCGKTDRVDIQMFWPLLAAIMAGCRARPQDLHPALTHQILNDPNPGSGDIISFPDKSAAKLVVLGDPISPSEMITEKWWPAAVSQRVRAKLWRRIAAEGLLLPIVLATAISLVGEMYTTTALPSDDPTAQVTGRRRVRLTHNRSPISDIGIIAGTPRVTPQDRFVYYMPEEGFMTGQDPADHFWLYFTTLSGEELYLDCGMYTFNFCLMVGVDPYCQFGWPKIGTVPGFWFGREYQKALPVAVMDQLGWKSHKRFSILRDPRVAMITRGYELGHGDKAQLIMDIMDEMVQRTCSLRDQEYLMLFYTMASENLRQHMRHRTYLKFPKVPQCGIDTDPDEDEMQSDAHEELHEVHTAYLAKLGRKVKNHKITLEQWKNAFEEWTNKPEEAKIKMWRRKGEE